MLAWDMQSNKYTVQLLQFKVVVRKLTMSILVFLAIYRLIQFSYQLSFHPILLSIPCLLNTLT